MPSDGTTSKTMCMSIGILKHEEEAKVEHTAMALISFRLLVPASEYHRFAAGRIKYGFPASKQRLFTAGTTCVRDLPKGNKKYSAQVNLALYFFALLRRGRDSNPRNLSVQQFSRLP